MGTPDFAVASLDILIKNNYNIIAVITAPDKPAGRGQQVQESAVKKYAVENGLNILQPEKLKDEYFLQQLRDLNADLQIVVAFRMLPEVVWNMPRMGTFNLHGSLLPQYRGAAPINWAVINGEKETGVTTFFLQHEIDTGKIIFRKKTSIAENETAGDIHDRLMEIGAELVLKTVKSIEENNYPQTDQREFITNNDQLKHAPKIFKDDCKINWQNSAEEIHNFIRGLSPYPTAFTNFIAPDGKTYSVKIFKTEKEVTNSHSPKGAIVTDSKGIFKVAAKNGYIIIKELQVAGKKKMATSEFLRGFQINNEWKAE
jgi:methionyl-tRNA formyltransferase